MKKNVLILSVILLTISACSGNKAPSETTASDSAAVDSAVVADSIKSVSSELWTTEAVAAQIKACYDEVNKQGEGDGPNINRLDEMFCSKDFLELRKQLGEKVRKGEVTFDGDEGWHWLPGVATPILIDSIKSELLTGDQAQAEVWLKDLRGNHGYLELNLYLENGAWKIHNWIDSDVYPFGAYYHWMQNLIDGNTNDEEVEEEESELSKYAE